MLLVGFVGGVQQIPANRLLVKNRVGARLLAPLLPLARARQAARARSRSCSRGTARASSGRCVTHRLPLERSVEAIRLLTDRKAHGKVVVVPGLAG